LKEVALAGSSGRVGAEMNEKWGGGRKGWGEENAFRAADWGGEEGYMGFTV